ncbi:MAG: LysR family transcriptional regulator [Burkholderiaceae bacterium]|nr:LysR family transcriptional regulator [Burkholderiaceae bacterium]
MIRYLNTLIAVARYGTFAAAGDRIGLTQSAVSVQMRKLEEALGLSLFDRSGRSAVLNDAGHRVLAHAEQIGLLFRQMTEGVPDAQLTGTLRVGAIMTCLLGDVTEVLPAFIKKFPKLEVHLTPGGSMELLTLVEKQRLDCALIVKPAYSIEGVLRWKSLRQEPFILLTAANEKLSNIDRLLSTRAFIRYDRHSHGGSLVDRFIKRKRYKLKETVESDSLESIGLLVARGAGIAIVPRTPALKVLGLPVREINLLEDTFYREIGLVEHIESPHAHLNSDFWRMLSKQNSVS